MRKIFEPPAAFGHAATFDISRLLERATQGAEPDCTMTDQAKA